MQAEIINLLTKKKVPMARVEIAKALKTTPIKVSLSIRKLVQYEEVQCIEIDRHEAMEKYNCKRRMRLFYVE